MEPLIYVIYAIIILATLVFAFGILQIYKAFHSYNWVQTQGTISRVIKKPVFYPESEYIKGFTIRIEYKYNINNSVITGDRIKIEQHHWFSLKETNKILTKYKANKTTSVFYNPDNPNECVLEKGLHINILVTPLIGLMMFIFGLISLTN